MLRLSYSDPSMSIIGPSVRPLTISYKTSLKLLGQIQRNFTRSVLHQTSQEAFSTKLQQDIEIDQQQQQNVWHIDLLFKLFWNYQAKFNETA